MKSTAELFPKVFELVSEANKEAPGGHDIYHALRVARWAQFIAIEEWGDTKVAELAGLAGLCHNADRIIEKQHGRWQAPNDIVEELVSSWLKVSNLPNEDRKIVLDTVLKHENKTDPTASRVQIAMMDADRVVNLELDLVIRSGQFYHDLPPVNYLQFLDDPTVSYKNPKSCLRDIAYSLDWADPRSPFCARTKTGLRLAQERAKHLAWFIETLKNQLEESSLVFKK